MGRNKIDLEKLHELLRNGKSLKEIAVFFGTSPVGVWKARKRLKVNIVKNLTPEATHKIIESDLDLMARMRTLSQVVNQQLEEAQKDILKATEPKEKRAIQEVLVKLAGEARKQVQTVLEIGQIWYSHKAYAEFREGLLDYLEQMSPGARARIMRGLEEKCRYERNYAKGER